MADENDSDDVLGSKEAAFFDPALPGRAAPLQPGQALRLPALRMCRLRAYSPHPRSSSG